MKKTVFITGASSGIGSALAKHYANLGCQIGLVARRADLLHALADTLSPRPLCYACDVRDAAAMKNAAADFISHHGVPDIVIANAGVSRGTLTEMENDLDAVEEIFDINVIGMVKTFAPFIAPMRDAAKGSLVSIASVAGFRGIPGGGAYSASKAAAITYCESLRVELRGSGIAVITICPGYIRTPMTAVNRFKMPFIIDVDDAVIRFAHAIDKHKSLTVIPWAMGMAVQVLRVLPNFLYDYLFSKMPRKPRQ